MDVPRVAVINSHPIQHFAPLWRDVARTGRVRLRIFYVSHRGLQAYADPHFARSLQWDVDLLSGYESEVLEPQTASEPLTFASADSAQLAGRLDAFRPDVVLLHGYAFRINWRALWWARRRGVRVMTISDSELRHQRPMTRRIAKEVVVRAFFSQLDGAFTGGDANAGYYQRYGLPERALHYCPLPVDRERFLAAVPSLDEARLQVRKALGLSMDTFVFAGLGKFVPWKRFQDVIAALGTLPTARRSRCAVLLVGDGPLRAELEAQARACGGQVVFGGFVNQSALPPYYAAADAVVASSEVDAKGLTPSEGHIFGRPTLVSDRVGCVGPNDVIRDGVNGIVYPCGDVSALASAMARLSSDPELYARLSAEASHTATLQSSAAAANDFCDGIEAVHQAPRASIAERVSRLFRVSAPSLGQRPLWVKARNA
ncbi:MAG: glycosyltransferase family 4 protein [Myxococcaceae bacterium]